MRSRKWRIISMVLATVMLFGCILPGMTRMDAQAAEYHNTYVNTGNQRQDMLGVALGQMGYTEGDGNDTKYGTWYGLGYQPWCAMFLTWCARQADISEDVLGRSAVASPSEGYFDIPYYSGKNYTPIPGDLFFSDEFTHVGLVYKVEGDNFYTIEGNSNALGEEDGFYVYSNKRVIAEYYFGVPPYKGGDKEHTYVKGQDASHPHKTYYKCTTCGDKYYTGYTEKVAGCDSCLSCGCSASYAGYYMCTTSGVHLNVRSGHSTSSEIVGGLSNGMVVYVHGATSSTGWACIECDGMVGHVHMDELTKYCPAPQAPQLTVSQPEFVTGENPLIKWTASADAEYYQLKIYRDGDLILNKDMGTTRSYTMKLPKAGAYEVQVTAGNKTGLSPAATAQFVVNNTYTVSYDLRGGSNGPADQTQVFGQVLWISDQVPERQGYTFLGWTDEPNGYSVVYEPGDGLSSYTDITLYAVWKDDNAWLDQLAIARAPARSMYLLGESLDTTGLELKLTYSDGSSHVVSDGYTTEGFNSENLGTCTVTIIYDTLSVTYDVQIVTYIPGDIDLNKQVDRDDVIRLLWHISFPDKFPVDTPADFNADGKVNRDDVMQLLWHVSFPDKFPLAVEEQEQPEPTEPEPTEPEVTEPEITEPEPTEPEPTEPDPTEATEGST